MTYIIFTASTGDIYEIYLRGANINSIFVNRNSIDTPYDDLPMLVREEILIAIIKELANSNA